MSCKLTKAEREARIEAIRAELLDHLAPGSEVFTILTHVASSGMSRRVKLLIPVVETVKDYVSSDEFLKPGPKGFLHRIDNLGQPHTGDLVPYAGIVGKVVEVGAAQDFVTLTYPAKVGLKDRRFQRNALNLYTERKVNRVRDISGKVADLLGDRTGPDGAIIVSGCGFNAAFQVVYNLGATLWPKGTPKPHGTRNGEPDRAGGYALKQREL